MSEERDYAKPESLTDEDIQEGIDTLTALKDKRCRAVNPYTRVCVGCGLQMSEAEHGEWSVCPSCGGSETMKLREREE